MTGTWRAKLHADPERRSDHAGLVPGRGFRARAPRPQARAARGRALPRRVPQTIKATGRYLYGPPAADLAIEGDIVVKPSGADVKGYPGFAFGQADETHRARAQVARCAPSSTDKDGKADIAVTLPQIPHTAQASSKRASCCACARRAGARSSASVTIPVDLQESAHRHQVDVQRPGPRREPDGGFEVVLLDDEGKRVAAPGLDLAAACASTRTGSGTAAMASGTTRPSRSPRKVANGTLDATADGALARIEAPNLSWGRYKLEVTSADASGPSASIAFNAGWYSASERSRQPRDPRRRARPRQATSRARPRKLRIASKQGGKALVAVLSGGLLSMQEVDVPNGGGEVPRHRRRATGAPAPTSPPCSTGRWTKA